MSTTASAAPTLPRPPADASGAALRARLAERVRVLEAVFRTIGAERMAGVPVLHPGLRVQAVGFAVLSNESDLALGILITPWFMSLVRLPLLAAGEAAAGARVAGLPIAQRAQRAQRRIGAHTFDFLGGFEPGLGAFESCSLFSPMGDFVDHGAAVATAFEVLQLLRGEAVVEPLAAPPQAAQAWAAWAAAGDAAAAVPPYRAMRRHVPAVGLVPSAPQPDAACAGGPADLERPARRGFLLGRRSPPGAAR